MGWDVVEIGLKHNLSVNDPFATAKEVANRMKQNIRLVYRNEYEYDEVKNVVRRTKICDFIELGKYKVTNSADYLRMLVSGYQASQIIKLVGIDKLRRATFTGELAKLILYDIEPFELYEIEDEEEKELYIRIFKENVNLDVHVSGRWHSLERLFHSSSQADMDLLHQYRMQIYNQAKMFGCKEVLICSDQGPTIAIFDNINSPADKLKEYAHSFQYLKDSSWVEESKKEDWKKNAKHIMFSSYFQNKLNLYRDDFVEVIYDDFNDISELA